MAVSDDNPGKNNPGKDDAPKQNPVRLTMGHYYCTNCGEDGVERSDARCPRCQDYLQWDRVDI